MVTLDLHIYIRTEVIEDNNLSIHRHRWQLSLPDNN